MTQIEHGFILGLVFGSIGTWLGLTYIRALRSPVPDAQPEAEVYFRPKIEVFCPFCGITNRLAPHKFKQLAKCGKCGMLLPEPGVEFDGTLSPPQAVVEAPVAQLIHSPGREIVCPRCRASHRLDDPSGATCKNCATPLTEAM